jgi:hypothetical protein
MSEKTQTKVKFDELINLYLENKMGRNTNDGTLELEVRFGTKGSNISYIDYTNVVRNLLSSNFTATTPNDYLRINCEYIDPKTGVSKISNIRSEISGMGNISKYCSSDSIVDNAGSTYCTFEQKSFMRDDDNNPIYPMDFEDFNFRVSVQIEKKFHQGAGIVRGIIDKWKDSKKTFRLLNRTTLKHNEYPVKVDISIVRSSRKEGRQYVPEYRFTNSGVTESLQIYEIEIEVDNARVGPGTNYNDNETLGAAIRKVIKLVMSGLQSTNYPVSYTEQDTVKNDYMELLGHEKKVRHYVKNRNFAGPSSFTLQLENIAPLSEDSNVPNINDNYTVTDKADGERKLLYIGNNRKIYLIDTNMKVQFTGSITEDKGLVGTLIDGEHILHNKNGDFINLYAAFDIYYLSEDDKRSLPFTSIETPMTKDMNNYRLYILNNTISIIKPISVSVTDRTPFRVQTKKFRTGTANTSIFKQCGEIINNPGSYEYETDGLIFTPALFAVGADNKNDKAADKAFKKSWGHSFKWKPPEYNTIDFLVSVKTLQSGEEAVGNLFKTGVDTNSNSQIVQYKTLILRVGFDEKMHGYINPCQNVIDDEIPEYTEYNRNEYRPMQFFPSSPSDDDAGICNIMLKDGNNGKKVMLTEEGETIEDNMIVEFRYVEDGDKHWKWAPLRIRYDKTEDLRNGGSNYGNDYRVANNNWHSIHFPVSDSIITSGLDSYVAEDDDVYYNKVSGESRTKELRNFHNLYVKNMLITKVSKPGNNMIDLAVGKGGDIPKWKIAKLNFVFGIDIAADNISNRKDGVCARYLTERKKNKRMAMGIFVNGNSSVNIRNTEGIISDQGKKITNAVFGKGAKEAKELGKGLYNVYGLGKDGFDITSIQFAIHYMFESQLTLHSFLRNVCEVTKVGGYFIGTSYDGASIFNLLSDKQKGESDVIMVEGDKIWEITKEYERTDFSDNSSCLGYAIDVYQESINKKFREYLVNYKYLTRLLENYGFKLVTSKEALSMGMPSGSGMFKELFDTMNKEIKRKKKHNYGLAPDMSKEQKKISFLNKYFVYKKTHNVNAETVSRDLLSQTLEDEMSVMEQPQFVQEPSTSKPSTSKPSTSKPSTSKPSTSKPSTSKPKKKITRLKLTPLKS